MTEQDLRSPDVIESMDSIGARTPYTCPTCNGTLWQINSSEPPRFRCHTGHAFTKDALVVAQNEHLEQALWSAVRLMEEKANLYRHLSTRRKAQGHFNSAVEYDQSAATLDDEVVELKRILVEGQALAPEPESSSESTGNGGSGAIPAESEVNH